VNIYQEPESMTGMKRYLLGVIVALVLLLGASAAWGTARASANIGSTDYALQAWTPSTYGGFVPVFYPSGGIYRTGGNTAWIQSETCLQYANYPGGQRINIECKYYPSQWTTNQDVPPPVMLYADPHNCEWINTWQWGGVLWTGGWQYKDIVSAAIRLC
jgi:hypothetical protein